MPAAKSQPSPIAIAPPGRIAVERVRGASRLTAAQVPAPLKLLNPAAPAGCCHLVLSNYGGGFLQGDLASLEIDCGPGARLLLGSQANTRVYRSQGAVAGMALDARLRDGSLAVAWPDPIVPHADSRFRQRQHWRLTPSARLILAETFVAGRLGTGERFAFDDFDSEVRISVENRLVLVDRLALEPARRDPAAPGAFGDCAALMTIYFAGLALESHARALEAEAVRLEAERAGGIVQSCAPFKNVGWILRVAAFDLEALAPLRRRMAHLLAEIDLLGFDPALRKWN